MSNYSDNPKSVRVDFWKPRTDGFKWYCTEAVIWTGVYDDGLIHCEFAKSLHDHLQQSVIGGYRLHGMLATCLEPYHQHQHPVLLYIATIGTELSVRGTYLKKQENQIRWRQENPV